MINLFQESISSVWWILAAACKLCKKMLDCHFAWVPKYLQLDMLICFSLISSPPSHFSTAQKFIPIPTFCCDFRTTESWDGNEVEAGYNIVTWYRFTLLWQEDEAKSLEMFLMLRPNNQFEALMKDTQFSQRFPIDNEDAIETYVSNCQEPLLFLPIFKRTKSWIY